MSLSPGLIKKLAQIYTPDDSVSITYKGKDVMIKTNGAGQAIRCFVGRLTEKGTVKGERYSRVLKQDRAGVVIKDHWELKGPAT